MAEARRHDRPASVGRRRDFSAAVGWSACTTPSRPTSNVVCWRRA